MPSSLWHQLVKRYAFEDALKDAPVEDNGVINPHLMDILDKHVKEEILPVPAVGGQAVGGLHDAGVRLKDPRPGGNLTGSKYSPQIIREIVQTAKSHNVDPKLALSIGLQETGLGSAQDNGWIQNPLHENYGGGGTNYDNAMALPRYGPGDSVHNHNAFDTLVRQDALDASMKHLNQIQKQYASSPEVHQIQAYNGLGKPSIHRVMDPKMYGVPVSQLPTDFYGKRVQDIRDNVVAPSAYLQSVIKGFE